MGGCQKENDFPEEEKIGIHMNYNGKNKKWAKKLKDKLSDKY